ncbi:hypothetical protein PV11_00552 [Exophiala sideris]|uniref:Uncharacterized protein n=1 Tax=Exophiala sideris TaxID=1016849 RepID=A0A0D1W7S3_9EURO|nr:hypothetical protein PV11_00552 [Exophiala sideris]
MWQYRWEGQQLGEFCDKGLSEDRPFKREYQRWRRRDLGQALTLDSADSLVGGKEGDAVDNDRTPSLPLPEPEVQRLPHCEHACDVWETHQHRSIMVRTMARV